MARPGVDIVDLSDVEAALGEDEDTVVMSRAEIDAILLCDETRETREATRVARKKKGAA